VLRPGGTLAFCGEPSRYGDLLAAVPKHGAQLVAPVWRLLLQASARRWDPAERLDGHELELEVDVHAFAPGALAGMLRDAGFAKVRIRGEELLASAYGWTVRTLEGTAEPDQVPDRWRQLAFRSHLAPTPDAAISSRDSRRRCSTTSSERQAGCLEGHPPSVMKPAGGATRLRRQQRAWAAVDHAPSVEGMAFRVHHDPGAGLSSP
jgi:hypothetical protein